MNLLFETTVEANAQSLWSMGKDVALLDKVSRPVISLKQLPPEETTWRQGGIYNFRIKLFGIIPWADHQVRMKRYCDRSLTFETDESGGPIKVWKHQHRLIPLEPNRAVCRDEIEIKAGVMSPLVWLMAQALYRKRHRVLRNIKA